MVMAATTTRYVFDLQPADVFWCTADPGWITGVSPSLVVAFEALARLTSLLWRADLPWISSKTSTLHV